MGDWIVPAPLIVALLISLVYAGLIAAHARLIRYGRRFDAYQPQAARWLAARLGPLPAPRGADGLAAAESEAIDRLLRGDIEPAAYRDTMADVAARAANHQSTTSRAR
ncbi:hypothetical protein [Dactylosporangium matsuzakiense]|uniref:hypothetical protein n=1 Tax=Dactylosporangium matsuzakiense TaxID=53360 RepID=UPI0021C3309E|nr:hypothetical protein [Dactylosporangium matsuzakiense]UWZ48140.1 hypothetical protein Dmats_18085 [Dactylosporangium matsuzakiense]